MRQIGKVGPPAGGHGEGVSYLWVNDVVSSRTHVQYPKAKVRVYQRCRRE